MVPPEAPQAVSIGLRNCYVARFGRPLKASKARPWNRKTLRSSLRRRPACFAMVPPEAPQAVSIGLRNCYVARFGRPLKASKAPQQLSKAFEPQNPPQQLAKVSRLLCHGTSPEAPQAVSIGLRNCYVARFGHPLKASKAPQQLSKAFEPQNPPQQLAKAPRLLCHSTPPEAPQAVSIGLRNCYVARFGHPLKASKAPQQLSKAFEPQKLSLLGFETATWHVLGTP